MQRVMLSLGFWLLAQTAFAHGREGDARHAHEKHGAVFTVSNEAEGNRILAFAAHRDGSLGEAHAVETGGLGTGDSLGSQGALALTEDHRFLIAVDAGSNEITALSVEGAHLTVTDRASSGGTRPISVTTRRGLVYVVNAGVPNTVQGFSLDECGKLTRLPHTSALSTADAGPAQIELTPDGEILVVAEKTTNKLSVYRVGAFGQLGAAMVNASAGMTPFGFELTKGGTLVVSEAGTGSASSYRVTANGALDTLSSVISDAQMAPCWVAITADERFAFVANAGSASISSYALDGEGHIALQDARAGDVGEDGVPLDLAFGSAGGQLYALDRGHMAVVTFAVGDAGDLTQTSTAGELPAFSSGLAAY